MSGRPESSFTHCRTSVTRIEGAIFILAINNLSYVRSTLPTNGINSAQFDSLDRKLETSICGRLVTSGHSEQDGAVTMSGGSVAEGGHWASSNVISAVSLGDAVRRNFGLIDSEPRVIFFARARLAGCRAVRLPCVRSHALQLRLRFKLRF